MTTSAFLIRHETVHDLDAITAVTVAAFAPLGFSSHIEQFIVAALQE